MPRQRIAIHERRPRTAIVADKHADEMQHFAEDASADSPEPSPAARDALSMIGAWSDLDWDELAEGLDRIRHDSLPTPSIDEL